MTNFARIITTCLLVTLSQSPAAQADQLEGILLTCMTSGDMGVSPFSNQDGWKKTSPDVDDTEAIAYALAALDTPISLMMSGLAEPPNDKFFEVYRKHALRRLKLASEHGELRRSDNGILWSFLRTEYDEATIVECGAVLETNNIPDLDSTLENVRASLPPPRKGSFFSDIVMANPIDVENLPLRKASVNDFASYAEKFPDRLGELSGYTGLRTFAIFPPKQ